MKKAPLGAWRFSNFNQCSTTKDFVKGQKRKIEVSKLETRKAKFALWLAGHKALSRVNG
jgi:hypothetical protein